MKGMKFLRYRVACVACLFVVLAACARKEPGMEPLTQSVLDAAEQRWKARGTDSYHLVLKVEAARMEAVMYDIVTRGGEIVSMKRDGRPIQPEHAEDYSIAGLFRLMRLEMHLMDKKPEGVPITLAQMFARFDTATGRPDVYRRTTNKSKHLKISVVEFQPDAALSAVGGD